MRVLIFLISTNVLLFSEILKPSLSCSNYPEVLSFELVQKISSICSSKGVKLNNEKLYDDLLNFVARKRSSLVQSCYSSKRKFAQVSNNSILYGEEFVINNKVQGYIKGFVPKLGIYQQNGCKKFKELKRL